MQPTQQLPLPRRQSSFNLDSNLANTLFQRIMIRLKIQKVLKHWKKLSKNSFNRYKRIEEWVNTQKTYIDDLNIITNQIQKPLRENNLITEEEEKILFPNLSSIIMLSQQMYKTMKEFLQKWHPLKTEIAPAVIKLSSFFKIYIEYFNNFEKGKQILARIRDEKTFKSIQKSLRLDIESYFIKPIQRPLKYKLLLTDYQKKLRLDHPDYNALTKAIGIYHEVVETTNQAMQNEKHMRRMIQMQAKFKNILQSSRQWKFEFEAWFEDEVNISRVYVFTDLILVLQAINSKHESLLCKMFLDASSFVEACDDVADQKKKILFIGGREEVGHFAFQTLQERNRIFQQLSKVINSIHVNEWKRKEEISKVESRRFSSARFSKPFYVEDYYEVFDQYNVLKKKFRISVCGVQRRVINKCYNSYFVVKLQLPFPQVINQKAFVRFEDLVELQRLLAACLNRWALVKAQNFQKIKWRSLQQLPKQLSKADLLQIDTIVAQHKARRIESFLNFILRNKELIKSSNLIFHKIKMFESLYERLIDDKYECEICDICHNGDIISNYETYQQELKKRLTEKKQRKEENFCIERSFHAQNRLASQKKQKPRCTIDEILLYINSKLGMINQALTNRIIQGEPTKIDIYRPHFSAIVSDKEERRIKWIQLDVYKKDTVGNVLELIRITLGLKGIKDYGLVLVSSNDQLVKILHDDEYIFHIIQENNLNIESFSNKQPQQQHHRSSIAGFFSKIKSKLSQSSDQKSSNRLPNTRIQLRKLYKFPQDIETFTCANDTVRYQLLSEEIFYLFKNKTINLHHTNIVKLCALFICVQWNSKFPYMKKEDISKVLLSEVIPQSRMHIVNENFVRQVWGILCIYKQRNIRQRLTFQSEVIDLARDNPGWSMQFFLVENLSPSITYPDKYLRIGINSEQIYIIRQNNYLAPIFRIKLDKLSVKFSGFLIVVGDEEREYRLLCDDVFMFRCALERYEGYGRFFLGRDRMVGKPLMEETI